jgi:putative endonuclease
MEGVFCLAVNLSKSVVYKMKYYVYILESELNPERHYIGMSYDIEKRLVFHNSANNTGYTRRYQPWRVIYSEVYECKSDAAIREKQLKGGKGRAWLKQNIYGRH